MSIFKSVILSAMLLSTIPSFSGVLDHLKKAPGKSDRHKMRNIDFIYMINLDRRPEKYAKSRDELAIYGIDPYRFSAVNGWELSLDTINDVGVKFTPGMQGNFMGTSYLPDGNFQPTHELIKNYGQTYFGHCMARGAIGIALSHISILQDAYDSGYETIWVMEDDIEIVRDPRIISDLIDRLDQVVGKDNWDILFTDRDTRDSNGNYVPSYGAARRPDFKFETTSDFAMKTVISPDFRKIESRFGAYSMIVRRSGMKKLLEYFKEHQVFLPYDMEFYQPRGIKPYTVLSDVVTTQARAGSDNAAPNYLNNRQ